MGVSRRELLLMSGGAVALVVACGGDDEGGDESACPGGPDIEIGNDSHRHELTITEAHVEAGTERTYTMTMAAGHTHEITVGENDFEKLANQGMVSVLSETVSGHDHQVILTC
jgi:hypothetical protein